MYDKVKILGRKDRRFQEALKTTQDDDHGEIEQIALMKTDMAVVVYKSK